LTLLLLLLNLFFEINVKGGIKVPFVLRCVFRYRKKPGTRSLRVGGEEGKILTITTPSIHAAHFSSLATEIQTVVFFAAAAAAST
jgi:hypothetical protein